MSKKAEYICTSCGNASMSWDANVYWDYEKQEWEVNDLHDYRSCWNCADLTNDEKIYPEELEEKYPIGTEKVVLVNDLYLPGGCGPWSGGEKGQYIKGEDQEQYWITNMGPDQEVKDGELVVLKKVTAWQWELVEEKAMEVSA